MLSGLISISLLTACGFHLRGLDGTDESSFERLYLFSIDAHGELMNELINQFRTAGVSMVESPGQADLRLEVSPERFSRRAASTTSDISVAEYEIQLEVDIVLSRDNGESSEATPKITLSEEQVYSFDSSSLTGTDEEEALLTKEMRRNLASRVIRRANQTFMALGKIRSDN